MNKNYRFSVKPSDIKAIKEITESTGFFYDFETDIAVELIEEAVNKGKESGYEFIICEVSDIPVAYTCYGSIACTKWSYDLYWIVTHADFRGKGIGKELLKLTENEILKKGGKNIYIETSSRELYNPTRHFYLSAGYTEIARLKDFYDDSDDKVIYFKKLPNEI